MLLSMLPRHCLRSLQQHQQLSCFLTRQVSSLQQQVQDLHQAAQSSQAAHKQVVDQLQQALSDKDLLEQQLQAVMVQGPAGSSLATALTVHLRIDCAANLCQQIHVTRLLPCSKTACLCL